MSYNPLIVNTILDAVAKNIDYSKHRLHAKFLESKTFAKFYQVLSIIKCEYLSEEIFHALLEMCRSLPAQREKNHKTIIKTETSVLMEQLHRELLSSAQNEYGSAPKEEDFNMYLKYVPTYRLYELLSAWGTFKEKPGKDRQVFYVIGLLYTLCGLLRHKTMHDYIGVETKEPADLKAYANKRKDDYRKQLTHWINFAKKKVQPLDADRITVLSALIYLGKTF